MSVGSDINIQRHTGFLRLKIGDFVRMLFGQNGHSSLILGEVPLCLDFRGELPSFNYLNYFTIVLFVYNDKTSGFSRNHKIESPTSRQEAQTRGFLQKIPPAQLSVGINTEGMRFELTVELPHCIILYYSLLYLQYCSVFVTYQVFQQISYHSNTINFSYIPNIFIPQVQM